MRAEGGVGKAFVRWWEADVAFDPLSGQHFRMTIDGNRWLPLAGLAILVGGPIAFSYPFLAAWNHSGISANPFDAWLYVDLLVALIIGCTGLALLRFRVSTKALMLLFYIPTMSAVLLAWSFIWCPLCDF